MPTTISPAPRRHGSSFLHRHHSSLTTTVDSNDSVEPLEPNKRSIFEGTDTIVKNRRLALKRIIEAHDALELSHIGEAGGIQGKGARILSNDRFSLDFSAIDLPSGEMRTFRYLLRRWDSSESPDSEFDNTIKSSRSHFETAAIRHFLRRIALWHESEELLSAATKEMTDEPKKNKTGRKESELSKMWLQERGKQGHGMRDELKETTTREGLAQLLWTLMHDAAAPVAPGLFNECQAALKKKYGMEC